jgi:hypothetical protein
VQCLGLAITNREVWGVWGGVNLETDRADLAQQPTVGSPAGV